MKQSIPIAKWKVKRAIDLDVRDAARTDKHIPHKESTDAMMAIVILATYIRLDGVFCTRIPKIPVIAMNIPHQIPWDDFVVTV